MQANYDPETAATVWNSPAYHTTAIKWTSPVTSSLFLEAGFSNNTEYYTNEYREGIEKPRGTAEWFANAAQERARPRRLHAGGPDQHHREPGRVLLERGGDVRQGRPHHQVRRQQPPGHVQAHARRQRRPGAAVPQQPAPASAGRCPTRVLIRNTPLVLRRAPEPRPRHLHPGLVAPQPPDREHRPALGDAERARCSPASRRAGRFVPERTFAEIKDVPDWNDFAPRMALVYDLFGNGRTAIKYSLNRYNLSRTTGIAAELQPAAAARRRRCRGATSTATTSPTARSAAPATRARPARSTSRTCRPTSASPRSTSTATTRAPGTSSRGSRSSTSCSTACRSAARGGRATSTT